MANLLKVTEEELTNVAAAIRAKGNTGLPLVFPDGFIDAIEAIQGGGGTDWKGELKKYFGGAVCDIPDTVTVLGPYAFVNYANLTNAMVAALPAILDSIGEYCFSGCSQLTEIDLSDRAIEAVGSYAFDGCSGVTILDLSGNDLQAAGFGDHICNGMSSLVTIDISGNENLTIIPAYFANGLSNLTNFIYTGCPIEEIGDNAFSGCGKIVENFPFGSLATLKTIGSYAFNNKLTYKTLTIDLTGTALEELKSYAFNCSQNLSGPIATVKFPASIVTIGDYAFYGNKLTSVDLTGCASLKSIGAGAFQPGGGSFSMASLDLSDCTSLETIGANLMYRSNNYHTSIGQLTFPAQTLTSIGNSAFRSCGLASQGPLTVKAASIAGDAFNGCSGITILHVYDCLQYAVSVFANCTNITEAHIHTKPTGSWPSNISTYPVFNNCSALRDIYVPWSAGEIAENKFVKSSQNVTWHYDYIW